MDEARKDLCRYRLDKAKKCLLSAKVLARSEDYCGAANRSYYAMFHCIRSLLALEGVDFSKHAGVMAYFQKNYVKSGIFGKEYSKILTEAFQVRSDSDYDDYYMISKEEVEEQIENAVFFFDSITKYVNDIFISEKGIDPNKTNMDKETKEPIYITKNGEGDLVLMSIDAFEKREEMLNLREKVLQAEQERIDGAETLSIEQARGRLRERLNDI